MAATKKGEGGRKASAQRPRRNVVPPQSDRQTAPTDGIEVDPVDSEGDLDANRVDPLKLSARQRSFVEELLKDPERNLSMAAWRAGYSGGGLDKPYPTEKRKRQTLAQQASKVMQHPGVAAYRQELEARAAAAFLASPEASAIREHAAARAAGEADLEKLAATNLGIMIAIAHHDIRSAVKWGPGRIEVTASEDLSYEEQLLVREVRHDETFHKDGSTTVTTTVKLADRMPYVKMLEGRLGKRPATKVEVSGPDGKPVQHAHEITAPSDELLDELARGVLGVVPATKARPDLGVPLEDIGKILRAWKADGNTHCVEPEDLFAEEHWAETRTRYLRDVEAE